MAQKVKAGLLGAVILLVFLGVPVYGYFFSNYRDRHLFENTYGHYTVEPWHWQLVPLPIVDADGTRVFVDYSKNELAVVFDSVKGSAMMLARGGASELSIVLAGHSVTIPASPHHCVLVDESGSRVIRDLRPGEAKELFERFSRLRNTGKLRDEIQSLFPETVATTTSMAAVGRWMKGIRSIAGQPLTITTMRPHSALR